MIAEVVVTKSLSVPMIGTAVEPRTRKGPTNENVGRALIQDSQLS